MLYSFQCMIISFTADYAHICIQQYMILDNI